MRTLIAVMLLIAAPWIAPWRSFTQEATVLARFDYDPKAPLDVKEVGVTRRGDVAVHDISYASPRGGRVPAYLVVPDSPEPSGRGGSLEPNATGVGSPSHKGDDAPRHEKVRGPFAAVIWGHWYWSNSEMRNRKEFLDEAVAFAGSGVVSLLTDGPIARPGHQESHEPLNDQQIADRVQQILDMRRGADLLLGRKDVDAKRIAFVGHSYNATTGAFLSGIDRRFKAFVLMAGSLSDEVDFETPAYQQYRQKVGPEKFDAFVAKYSWLDQGKFVSRAAPATVFMQFATEEDFLTPDVVRQYAAIVSEPKRFKLYEAPHALSAEARRDRLQFLAEELDVRQLTEAQLTAIPDLYQPPVPKE